MTELTRIEAAWLENRDGASGHAFGEALEATGDLEGARAVYDELIAGGYLVGFYDLAWLEHASGNHERARELLRAYLDGDDAPDEQTALVNGVLGHWIWDESGDLDAEPLLASGMDVYTSARADLADLYRATGRQDDAERILREGVDRDELESFIVLGNLLDETGRTAEAEAIYRRGFQRGDGHCALNLSILLRREGRADEADEWVRLGVAHGDENARNYLATALSSVDEG